MMTAIVDSRSNIGWAVISINKFWVVIKILLEGGYAGTDDFSGKCTKPELARVDAKHMFFGMANNWRQAPLQTG